MKMMRTAWQGEHMCCEEKKKCGSRRIGRRIKDK
jgi:hypothetical protein